MPYIKSRLTKFAKRPQANFDRDVYVGEIDLLLTAAKVGMPTLAANPAAKRSLLEMQWRMAMVAANVEISTDGERWVRTPGYIRLDPSEKSAVSYFLGMTQAAIVGRIALGYPHLQHLDLLIKHQHPAKSLANSTRPDLVAADPVKPGIYNAVIEAKGRSNDFDKKALDDAKIQAAGVTGLHGLVPVERIASEGYFNAAGHWTSRMVDPDGDDDDAQLEFGLETYLMLYYRTIIDAGRQSPSWEADGDEYTFTVPGFPLRLRMPSELVEAYDDSTEIPSDDERDVEAIITEAYRGLAAEEDRAAATGTDVAAETSDGAGAGGESFNEEWLAAAADRWDLITGEVDGDDGEETLRKLFASSDDGGD